MKQIFLALVFLVASITIVYSQSSDRKWAISLNGGAEQYSGDFGGGFYNFDQAYYGFLGGQVARHLSPHFDAVLQGSYGEIGHVENFANRFRAKMLQITLNARYNFFKNEEQILDPYVLGGIGFMQHSNMNVTNVVNSAALPNLGAGLNVRITPYLSAYAQESFTYTTGDNIEFASNGRNDSYLQHTIGLTFSFGGTKDTDGDGISDSKDDCPEVAGPLDFNGCPDTDGDGIVDRADSCPTVKGVEQFIGCPDTDGDGIADSEDVCPDVKGLEAFKGCPDTDEDGVQDSEDACPEVKGLADLKGCPDTDGDGIADAEDACPKVAGSADLKGCPDTDGDGVADNADKCPDVAGVVSNKGCPEVKEEVKELLAEALHGVKFESGKDVIKTSSYSILDNVVSIMNNNPEYKLKIEGHTDSQGDDNMNLDLSKNRAKAVKTYITNKGVDASRMTSDGFGETVPVADNKTSAGRAENRRVELTVEF